MNAALDIRYRIIRENEGIDLFDGAESLWSVHDNWNLIPSLSFGIGAAYSHIGVNTMLDGMLFADVTGIVTADTEIFIRLQSYSLWWSIHLSKRIVFWDAFSERNDIAIWYIDEQAFYLIPYMGIRFAFGNGIIYGTENVTNIQGGPANPPEVFTLHQKEENGLSFSPVVYAGMGIKLFYAVLLNIGVSYDIVGGVLGAQFTAGYSR